MTKFKCIARNVTRNERIVYNIDAQSRIDAGKQLLVCMPGSWFGENVETEIIEKHVIKEKYEM